MDIDKIYSYSSAKGRCTICGGGLSKSEKGAVICHTNKLDCIDVLQNTDEEIQNLVVLVRDIFLFVETHGDKNLLAHAKQWLQFKNRFGEENRVLMKCSVEYVLYLPMFIHFRQCYFCALSVLRKNNLVLHFNRQTK